MAWRKDLEDKYTVRCKSCGHESIDPNKKPAQKYLKKGTTCPNCKKIS